MERFQKYFRAFDSQGYVVSLITLESNDGAAKLGGRSNPGTRGSIRTDDGRSVTRLAKGRYLVNDTSELLFCDDQDAP